MAVATLVTLAEFLALPETEPPSEFVGGRILRQPGRSFVAGLVVTWLGEALGACLSNHPIGFVVASVLHADFTEDRAYLPDLAVILRANLPRDGQALSKGPIEFRPDLAIEILSPDDRPGRVADKLAFYLRTGVPLTWIIDLEEWTLTAYRPGEPSTVHQAPEVIGAAPVLPGAAIDLGRLFGELDAVDEV